jgi:hypothetical protein
MIEWNKYELTEFFGVLPEEDEDQTYLSFSVEKDGIRLNTTFFHYIGDVYVDVFRGGINEPIFRTIIDNSAEAKYINQPNGYKCLEIAASVEDVIIGKERNIPMIIRLKVNPNIGVELLPQKAV